MQIDLNEMDDLLFRFKNESWLEKTGFRISVSQHNHKINHQVQNEILKYNLQFSQYY